MYIQMDKILTPRQLGRLEIPKTGYVHESCPTVPERNVPFPFLPALMWKAVILNGTRTEWLGRQDSFECEENAFPKWSMTGCESFKTNLYTESILITYKPSSE